MAYRDRRLFNSARRQICNLRNEHARGSATPPSLLRNIAPTIRAKKARRTKRERQSAQRSHLEYCHAPLRALHPSALPSARWAGVSKHEPQACHAMREMYLPILPPLPSLDRPSLASSQPPWGVKKEQVRKEGDAFDRLLLKRKFGWRNRDLAIHPSREVVRSGTHNRSPSLARAGPTSQCAFT